MSLQTILSVATSLEVNDHRLVGQFVSRNQRISTSEVLTVVPFQFTIIPNNYLRYSQNRSVLANLRFADRAYEQYLNFATTGWVHYVSYRGDMTSTQIGTVLVQASSSGKTIVLGSLPTLTPTSYVVRVGDWIQIDRYAYIATTDVLRGSGTTVSIPVHRSLLTTVSAPLNAVIGQYGTTTSLGGNAYTGVTVPVILQDYPNYVLTPGPNNDSFLAWNGSFKALEVVL